jgi:hypothetical protein
MSTGPRTADASARNAQRSVRDFAPERAIVEHLWSQAGATCGNRSQMAQLRTGLKQADPQPAATHGNGSGAHGKEGVDGSSPSEGSAKAPHVGAFLVQTDLLFVEHAVGMEPFMELPRSEPRRGEACLG